LCYILLFSDADTSGGTYREEEMPVIPIQGTNLFTGLAYRLYHEDFGKAPIAAKPTVEGLQVKLLLQDWQRLPYTIFAERRQPEWAKYA